MKKSAYLEPGYCYLTKCCVDLVWLHEEQNTPGCVFVNPSTAELLHDYKCLHCLLITICLLSGDKLLSNHIIVQKHQSHTHKHTHTHPDTVLLSDTAVVVTSTTTGIPQHSSGLWLVTYSQACAIFTQSQKSWICEWWHILIHHLTGSIFGHNEEYLLVCDIRWSYV